MHTKFQVICVVYSDALLTVFIIKDRIVRLFETPLSCTHVLVHVTKKWVGKFAANCVLLTSRRVLALEALASVVRDARCGTNNCPANTMLLQLKVFFSKHL